MISYDICFNVDKSLVFKAFEIGFSDYIIKTNFTIEAFLNRFFGPEGNSLDNSFIAMDGKEPIGVILGGIKLYEGIKTMRCGALAIHPGYRGKGISNKLFELHKQVAINKGCKQLFLEVIVGNDRAINFYKKLGYEKIYDLSYFTLDNTTAFINCPKQEADIRPISKADFARFFKESHFNHISWQNDLEAIEKVEGTIFYGGYINDKLVSTLAINNGGKISHLWVNNEYRNKNIATMILAHACKQNNPSKLIINFSNNALLQGFIKRKGFKKDNIAQYEMYLTL
jgi:ribosomal protein S18 acetylase RimI-like enzyme